MKCNCIEEKKEEARKHIIKTLNIKDEDIKRIGIAGQAILLDTGMEELTGTAEVSYMDKGKERKGKVGLRYTYCPFCSKKYSEKEDDKSIGFKGGEKQ